MQAFRIAAQSVKQADCVFGVTYRRLEPRLGRNKAIVAIARKLLIAVWYVMQGETDKYAEPEGVAQKMLRFAYQVGKARRPKGQTAAQFARLRMDALGLGSELTSIRWGAKKPIPLPPSTQKERSAVPNLS